MFKEMVMLASSNIFQTGVIGELLSKWEEMGFFSYLLPFLLIFALVFGILNKVNIFKDNKMINGIIALAVGFMALQFDFVPTFFSEIFPRMGVALSIILVIFIVAGMFIDTDNKAINYILLGIGVIMVGMVVIQSAGALGWQSGDWWGENWQMVIGGLFLFLLIAVIIGSSVGKSSDPKKRKGKSDSGYFPIYARDRN